MTIQVFVCIDLKDVYGHVKFWHFKIAMFEM